MTSRTVYSLQDLEGLAFEFTMSLDGENKDEWYATDRDLHGSGVAKFLRWLSERNLTSAADTMSYFDISDSDWDKIPYEVQVKLRKYVRHA